MHCPVRWSGNCKHHSPERNQMKYKIATSAGLLVTSACLLLAAVRTDYDHKADFGRYHQLLVDRSQRG